MKHLIWYLLICLYFQPSAPTTINYCTPNAGPVIACFQKVYTAWVNYRNVRFGYTRDKALFSSITTMQQMTKELANSGLLCQIQDAIRICSQSLNVDFETWKRSYFNCSEMIAISVLLRPLALNLDPYTVYHDGLNHPKLIEIGLEPFCNHDLNFFVKLSNNFGVFDCMYEAWAFRWQVLRSWVFERALRASKVRVTDPRIIHDSCIVTQQQYIFNWLQPNFDFVAGGRGIPGICFPEDDHRRKYCNFFGSLANNNWWSYTFKNAPCNFSPCQHKCNTKDIGMLFYKVDKSWRSGCTYKCHGERDIFQNRWCQLKSNLESIPFQTRNCPGYFYSNELNFVSQSIYGDDGLSIRPRPLFGSLWNMSNHGCSNWSDQSIDLKCILTARQQFNNSYWKSQDAQLRISSMSYELCHNIKRILHDISQAFRSSCDRDSAKVGCELLQQELLSWKFNLMYNSRNCDLKCESFENLKSFTPPSISESDCSFRPSAIFLPIISIVLALF